MNKLLKFLLIGFLIQSARTQFYQQQPLMANPYMYSNPGFASPIVVPQQQNFGMPPVQYPNPSLLGMGFQNPIMALQQPVPRSLSADVFSQHPYYQKLIPQYLENSIDDLNLNKADFSAMIDQKDSETLKRLKESLDKNDKKAYSANTPITVDTPVAKKAVKPTAVPRKAMDTDNKKMKVLQIFKGYLNTLKNQKIKDKNALVHSFSDYFKDDKEFYTKNFLESIVKSYNSNKQKIRISKVESAIVKKLLSVDLKDTKLETISKLPRKQADDKPTGKKKLKFFKHVKKALKKRGLSLPNHFYKNYIELKKMAKLYEYKLKHPKAKKNFNRKLFKLKLEPTEFKTELEKKQQYFQNFENYYKNLKSNLKTKKIEKMMNHIQRILCQIRNAKYGVVYIEFIKGFSARHIDGNNITSSQVNDLSIFLSNLIHKYNYNAYLDTVFKIFKSFKDFGNIHFNSNDKTLISFPLFLQFFKNKVKSGELRFLLLNFFEMFFDKFDRVESKLMAVYPELRDQVVFDYAKFLSELFKHYSFTKFIRLNNILGEFDSQLQKIDDSTDERYKPFVGELVKIFFTIFKNFLIIIKPDSFVRFATYYDLNPQVFPSIEAYHIQNEDNDYHSLPNTNGELLHDENPGDSQLLEQGDPTELFNKLSSLIESLQKPKDGSANQVNNIQPTLNEIENDLKKSYPTFYSKYRTILDRDQPSTMVANVNSSPDIETVKATLEADHNSNGGMSSNLTADFHMNVGPKKQIRINMKLVKKGRMVTDLLYEFLRDNSADENSALIDKLNTLSKDIQSEYNKKLDVLFDTLSIYTKKLESVLHKGDVQKLKNIWKTLVMYYSKNCHLLLYKKVIARLVGFKNEKAKYNFHNLSTILGNFVLFLTSNKKYNFKPDCDQISKLIVIKKKLTMFKLKKLNMFHILKKALFKPIIPDEPDRPESPEKPDTPDNPEEPSIPRGREKDTKGRIYKRKKNNIMHLIKKALEPEFVGAFRKGNSKRPPPKVEDEPAEDEYLKHTKNSRLNDFSGSRHHPIHSIKTVVYEKRRGRFKQIDQDPPEDGSEPNKDIAESELNFIKQIVISTLPQIRTIENGSDATSKQLFFNIKPKLVNYLKFIRTRYGDVESALKSKRGYKVFEKLNKIYYKKHPDIASSFLKFKSELLHEFFVNKIKTKISKGQNISSQKLIYKPRLDNKKQTLLKLLFNKFNTVDFLKQKGLGKIVFSQLNKVLYKPFTKLKDMQLLFNKLRSINGNIKDQGNNFASSSVLSKAYYKPLGDESTPEEPPKDEEPVVPSDPGKCKLVKHCKSKCYKIVGEEKVEIQPDDPLYKFSVCNKEDESGEEEIACGKTQDFQTKQINLSPVFLMNIEVDTPQVRDKMVEFLKNASFIKKLANSNEIDIDEYKKEVANFATKKSFKIDLTPYDGDDEVSRTIKALRSKISTEVTGSPNGSGSGGMSDSLDKSGQEEKDRNSSRSSKNKHQRYSDYGFIRGSDPEYDEELVVYDQISPSRQDSDVTSFRSQRYLKDEKAASATETESNLITAPQQAVPAAMITQQQTGSPSNKII